MPSIASGTTPFARSTIDALYFLTVSYFVVRQGKKRKLLGIGFLLKTSGELPEERWGLAVSTYGKVIKRGWEWLGITPKNPNHLAGVVELPGLVDCLTTNKCDFMRDPNSLQKYYKYRRAVQDAVAGVLEQLGEARSVAQLSQFGIKNGVIDSAKAVSFHHKTGHLAVGCISSAVVVWAN